MSYAVYGNFTHVANECNMVSRIMRSHLSQRGRRQSMTVQVYLSGESQETGSALLQRCQSLMDAYATDYLDFRYYLDDGTAVPRHDLLNTGNCISGVHVIHRSWTRGDGAELATKRTFSVTLQATYDVADSEIVTYYERLKYIGNGGPSFTVIPTFYGGVPIQTAAATPQYIIQSGRCVTYSAYFLPPGPLFPSIEHQEQREVELITPQLMGTQFRFYTTTWTYRYTNSGGNFETIPTAR